MKPATSLYPFFTSMVICKASIIFIIIILICRKLGSVGPVQQKSKLLSVNRRIYILGSVYSNL